MVSDISVTEVFNREELFTSTPEMDRLRVEYLLETYRQRFGKVGSANQDSIHVDSVKPSVRSAIAWLPKLMRSIADSIIPYNAFRHRRVSFSDRRNNRS